MRLRNDEHWFLVDNSNQAVGLISDGENPYWYQDLQGMYIKKMFIRNRYWL